MMAAILTFRSPRDVERDRLARGAPDHRREGRRDDRSPERMAAMMALWSEAGIAEWHVAILPALAEMGE